MVIKLEEGSQSASKRAVQLRQAIRDTLAEEMRRDDRIIVLGEDVGKKRWGFSGNGGFDR